MGIVFQASVRVLTYRLWDLIVYVYKLIELLQLRVVNGCWANIGESARFSRFFGEDYASILFDVCVSFGTFWVNKMMGEALWE